MARSVLEKKGSGRCYPLEDIAKTLDDTYRNVMLKVRLYKWAALALLTLIPILSALLSLLITPDEDGPLSALRPGVPYVSYVLTLLTILSSIFNPGERFKRICLLGIDLGELRTRAFEAIEKFPQGEVHDHELVDTLRTELHPYREQLVELFLPEIQSKKFSAEPNNNGSKAEPHG